MAKPLLGSDWDEAGSETIIRAAAVDATVLINVFDTAFLKMDRIFEPTFELRRLELLAQ